MKKKIVSEMILTLLLVSMLTSSFNALLVEAHSRTWYVDDDGGVDFTKIQDAIDAARPGDTIYVYNGTYYEHVVVKKTVSLIGEHKSATIIDGSGTGNVITIYVADSVIIRDFTIQRSGPSPYCGIEVIVSNHVTIENNNIKNNAWGIDVYDSNNNKITNNLIADSTDMDGVYFYQSTNNRIEGNRITNNRQGIFLCESGNNSIISNQIVGNRYWGMEVWGLESDYNVISSNNVSHNGFAHFVGLDGIYVDLSSNNIIHGNTVSVNARDGVLFSRSSNNTVYGNKIFGNEGRAGILLSSWGGRYSTNNLIVMNDIASNEYGIYLDRSNDNFIYHNNFIHNTKQVLCRYGLEVNIWDNGYPSGGNHWSDYSAKYPSVGDEYKGENQNIPGSDGVWDHPYVIDANNKDNYPLVRPWTLNPIDAIQGLIETIETWNLPKGTESSLTFKLDDALHLFTEGNENGAIHKLMDFIDQVESLRDKKLTNLQADYLISEAQRIIDLIKA